jgi:3-deoxy-manno-octulosonate cytidylyltransferase (CMP-KDO synthetase)
LEGKVILMIDGKPLVQYVYEAAIKVKDVSEVIIATDHSLVMETVQNFGGNAMMTSKHHASGTDRIGEIAKSLKQYDIFINVQADEPLIKPGQIEEVIHAFYDSNVNIATQRKKLDQEVELFDYNVVKVVCDQMNNALYFSRNAIPAHRDLPYQKWIKESIYYKHIGLYGYRRETLLELVELSPSFLEKSEKLEQLRWLENGYKIKCLETNHYTIGIDTEEDLIKVEKIIKGTF